LCYELGSMNQFFTFLRERWRFVLVVCVVLFLASNTLFVRGGICTSSPCNSLGYNQSNMVNDFVFDLFGDSKSIAFLSPTVVLISPMLDLFGFEHDVYRSVTTWHVFDDQDQSFVASGNMVIAEGDVADMRVTFVLMKVLVFLSFPIWFLYAYFLHLIWQKHFVGRVFVVLFLFGVLMFARWPYLEARIFPLGANIQTWQVLF